MNEYTNVIDVISVMNNDVVMYSYDDTQHAFCKLDYVSQIKYCGNKRETRFSVHFIFV
jgi:hypothetical protein